MAFSRRRRIGRYGNPFKLLNLAQCLVPWVFPKCLGVRSVCPFYQKWVKPGPLVSPDRNGVSGSPPGTTTTLEMVVR